MKALAAAVAILLASTAGAVTYTCGQLDAIKADVPGCADATQLVCINDFQYTPPVTVAKVGETVAWVNIEACGDNPVEDLVVDEAAVGCDPHHQVVTQPVAEPATGDAINEQNICSPHPGVVGLAAPTQPLACAAGETNVRCHTFGAAGVQHYTCLTNEGHNALMHGGIVVQP